jgi:hypothetical protein
MLSSTSETAPIARSCTTCSTLRVVARVLPSALSGAGWLIEALPIVVLASD